jgi:hypothetical protein
MNARALSARRFKSVLYSCCILFVLPTTSLSAEYSAEDVMRKVDERYVGDSSVSDITMVLIDRRDRQRIRNLKLYSKDFGVDTKTLSLFESPADIRGTAYLNFDWNESLRDDDSWLYLPALQRVKRIATSDTSDSFLGSDFTYADINGFEIEWYDYNFLNESEMVDGEDSWVIEIIPKPEFKDRAEEATGYSKMQSWISKEKFVQLRGQVWEIRGNRVKFVTASEVELIEDIWTVKRLQAITTRNDRQEHASVLQINSIDYNADVADDLLTTEAMQRGLD